MRQIHYFHITFKILSKNGIVSKTILLCGKVEDFSHVRLPTFNNNVDACNLHKAIIGLKGS